MSHLATDILIDTILLQWTRDSTMNGMHCLDLNTHFQYVRPPGGLFRRTDVLKGRRLAWELLYIQTGMGIRFRPYKEVNTTLSIAQD